MALGWKWLIPVSLVWIVAVATIRAISLDGGIDRKYLLIGIGVLAVLFLVLVLRRRGRGPGHAAEAGQTDAVDAANSGAFPIPPMPAGGAVRGAAAPLHFGRPVPATVSADVSGDDHDDRVTTEERLDG